MIRILVLITTVVLLLALPGREQASARPALNYSPEVQSAQLFYDEAMTVYLGNLERRKSNSPPLRWNREMTLASRWFSWDSVENRPNGYCGHTDSEGGAPWDRTARFGYLGFAGAENAYCGYMLPQDAIHGWMNSPGHRENLLEPMWREVGLGYYRRTSDGRGYIAQVFGTDSVYNPVIIDNEAPSVNNETVELYIYSPSGHGGLSEMGPAQEMMISNEACFTGANWTTYQTTRSWSLSAGNGWKQVYAKLRDTLGRTAVASDSIYRGTSLPIEEIDFEQLSTTRSSVTLHNLNSNGMPGAQFSLGWIVDDVIYQIYDFNQQQWNPVPRVDDVNALGGTAYQMSGSYTWAWAMTGGNLPKGQPLIAYFRMKTASRPSSDVMRLTIKIGDTNYSRQVKGTDFTSTGVYQEFPVAFTLPANYSGGIIFDFSLTSSVTMTMDTISVFTDTQPISGSSYTWNIPGGNYRGQGVWVRYADGNGNFTAYQDAVTQVPIATNLSEIAIITEPDSLKPTIIKVNVYCGDGSWSVKSKPDWLQTSSESGGLSISSSAGLGDYQGILVLQTSSADQTVSIPVRLLVVENVSQQYLPMINR
jgi:uncharacterized protein YkwD